MKSKLLLTLLLTMTTMLKAEISKDLQGSWILDKAETRKELKKDTHTKDNNLSIG